eukprot:7957476-Pyramimonas_sp.AAC.1
MGQPGPDGGMEATPIMIGDCSTTPDVAARILQVPRDPAARLDHLREVAARCRIRAPGDDAADTSENGGNLSQTLADKRIGGSHVPG